MMLKRISISAEVDSALSEGCPVVALESTLITHGLPNPENYQCAISAQDQVRAEGAVPATIAVLGGQIKVGLDPSEINQLIETEDCHKLSRHDLATACAKGLTGGTTVAATMICARMAGIRVFATGGIGGVHRGWQDSFDISADLQELSQTPVTVVCSGAKSLLDLPATMEMLETLGVPVVGLGTRELPAFFSVESGIPLHQWADDIAEVAQIIQARQQLALGGGELVVVPPPAEQAVPRQDVEQWITQAVSEATASGLAGKTVTPYLLDRIAALSGGTTLKANIALIKNNAAVAGQLAVALRTS